MREADVEFIRSIFSSVIPHLVYPQDLRETLEELLDEKTDIKEFLERLGERIGAETDPTRKTDGKILLNELRRRLSS
jgi:hypothetical protein